MDLKKLIPKIQENLEYKIKIIFVGQSLYLFERCLWDHSHASLWMGWIKKEIQLKELQLKEL